MVESRRWGGPSKQAIIGRYILTPAIFDVLEKTTPGAGANSNYRRDAQIYFNRSACGAMSMKASATIQAINSAS